MATLTRLSAKQLIELAVRQGDRLMLHKEVGRIRIAPKHWHGDSFCVYPNGDILRAGDAQPAKKFSGIAAARALKLI